MWDSPILVAYDGSDGAGAALAWALVEGARRGLPVHLVTVLGPHRERHGPGGHAGADVDLPLVEAESVLDKVAFQASTQVPGVEVTGQAVIGAVTSRLCELSARSGMVVLGSRGLGGFAALAVGSVTVAVTAHAHCPVVVVRDDAHAAGQPVVLGVDDSRQGRLAAQFAFDEAASRKAEVVAVRALEPRHPHLHSRGWVSTVEDMERVEAERRLVDEVLAPARASFPQVPVAHRLVDGTAGAVLCNPSARAQLLVVGSRGRGGFHGLLLGSVVQQVLNHARCPVAVVRGTPVPVGNAASEVDQPPARMEQ